MAFIAVLQQDGGCDYTIACGTKVVELPADIKFIQDAEAWLVKNEHVCGSDGMSLDDITLYDVIQAIPLAPRDLWETWREPERKKLERQEARERAVYAELHKKYGKGTT